MRPQFPRAQHGQRQHRPVQEVEMPPAVVYARAGKHGKGQRKQPQKNRQQRDQARRAAGAQAAHTGPQRRRRACRAQEQHPQRRGRQHHIGQVVPGQRLRCGIEHAAAKQHIPVPALKGHCVGEEVTEKGRRVGPQRGREQRVQGCEGEDRHPGHAPDARGHAALHQQADEHIQRAQPPQRKPSHLRVGRQRAAQGKAYAACKARPERQRQRLPQAAQRQRKQRDILVVEMPLGEEGRREKQAERPQQRPAP